MKAKRKPLFLSSDKMKKNMGAIVKLNTIHEYNMAVGVETLHPLVSVVDFSTLK